jgi:hypothetical protein
MDAIANTATLVPVAPKQRRLRPPHVRLKDRIVRREHLDRRTTAFKEFEQIVSGIKQDLGHEPSRVELGLIEAFAGACVVVDALNARLVSGQEIDLTQHAIAVSAMTRVATKLGIKRKPKPGPGLSDFLAQLKPGEASP